MFKGKSKKAMQEFKEGKHNIGFVSSSFLNEFGNDPILKGSILNSIKLKKSMSDSQIISELGIQECTLGDILETLKYATNDMEDGYSNIFYIKGHSRVVGVFWGGSGWGVDDWDRGGDWGEGRRVFSPATISDSNSLISSPSESLILPHELIINGIHYIKK